ncbi:MAG: Maf family protein [Lachnospiraceae bacterium]|nr:Maf family protein [Lachnospiraceae bacterium]
MTSVIYTGYEVVLASASPRRKELMDRTGIRYLIDPSDVDENVDVKDPGEAVRELSRRKALKGLESHPGAVVIGADTVVSLNGSILGKPADREDAFRMLTGLSGQIHQVYTGVTLAKKEDNGKILQDTFSVCTEVEMYENTEEMIRWYISTGEPLDKAGAYGIQGMGTFLIKEIKGNYDNVVGLPVAELIRHLPAFVP